MGVTGWDGIRWDKTGWDWMRWDRMEWHKTGLEGKARDGIGWNVMRRVQMR